MQLYNTYPANSGVTATRIDDQVYAGSGKSSSVEEVLRAQCEDEVESMRKYFDKEQEEVLQRLHSTDDPLQVGVARLKAGRCVEASDLFRQADDMGGERFEGIPVLREAAERKIQAADVHVEDARHHVEQANWEEATQAYKQALAICKDHPEARKGNIRAEREVALKANLAAFAVEQAASEAAKEAAAQREAAALEMVSRQTLASPCAVQ
ncbi:hypothetical protein FNU76_23310 [Chitinimonas arctica]|uniref:Tetratricopeptide repeat protein n=1 Tax=Chitinimonas arctica TaxID=2594795 RepID=A0A516SLM3_9NEIS|nr:hypothetical protein [Chitinimonas arctica]QDQ29040.1 hypothetical protein FNU76_23310 [Chitinimonas arctica]